MIKSHNKYQSIDLIGLALVESALELIYACSRTFGLPAVIIYIYIYGNP